MHLDRNQKRLILIVVDMICLYLSGVMAGLLLYKDMFWIDSTLLKYITYIVVIYLLLAIKTKIFSIINRYTDYRTLLKILTMLTFSYASSIGLASLLKWSINVRLVILSFLFSVALMISSRLSWRFLYEFYTKTDTATGKNARRTLVVGAGDGANLFIKTVLQDPRDFDILAIVDRDKTKLNTLLHGVKVVASDSQIPDVVKKYDIEQIVIAIPSLKPKEYEYLFELCKQTKAKVSLMPKYEDVIKGNLSVSKLRDIDIADLLEREEVKLDQSSLIRNIEGKTILVTGAGGSIGSELCRQLARFSPKRILLLGHGENSIYLIHKELSLRYGGQTEFVPIIADIQDREKIFDLMREYRPHRVYHAAAHKHVPLMEYNPQEAVKNNIFGTKNVAEAAKQYGVAKFVMVSTDKAVNPPNVMGATKRVAEMIVTSLNEQSDSTLFAAVRFGNVLESRGSVVPLFKEQIANGGPVTVTDFEMTRYFMTIPEASRLVLQASALMQGGEVFVLDMGEPVKILDLAKKVIQLSGYSEEEIGIVESGIRPGEKLYEELLSTEERVSEQVYEKIFVGRVTNKKATDIQSFIDSLLSMDKDELKERLIAFARQE